MLKGCAIINENDVAFMPVELPFASAGFPKPSDDYLQKELDLNGLVFQNKVCIQPFMVEGDSMLPLLNDGDIITVDRSLTPKHGDLVVADLDDGRVVKRYALEGGRVILRSDNSSYKPIAVNEFEHFAIVGVVTYSLRSFLKTS
ncbi:MAG: S24 family peptidase [Proteobacteria bacterium]|nr:MAG: S24 family peptidase [Pseudomonadota bacterium]